MLVDDNSGVLTKYLNGDGIDNKLRQTTGSNVQYFLTDHLGSTNGLADASGNLTSSASYDSFGNATGNLSTRYQFTGREYDNFTGLHYYRARWYDSNLGRFISEDPIGFGGGDVNLYGYVGNNSIRLRDPSGKIVPLIIGGIVLGGIILASPSTINAPAPGDPIYYPDNPLLLNAAGGAVCGALWTKFVSPFLGRLISGMGSDIIELGISQGPTRLPLSPPSPSVRIPWNSWENYPKVTVGEQEYAQVGNRLFSRHAVDRMQPSGNRFWTGGQDGGMGQIRQTGGSYDYGRGVAPQFVEDIIRSTQGVRQLNGNISHMSGTLEVILNPTGDVVTIITH